MSRSLGAGGGPDKRGRRLLAATAVFIGFAVFAGIGLRQLLPAEPLGLPTVVVASRNDPVMTFPRARHWAATWGAELVDLGEAGHINAEAGFGRWAYGLAVLNRLAARAGLISSAD